MHNQHAGQGHQEAPLRNIWSGTEIPASITPSMLEIKETYPVYIARLELDLRGTGRVFLDVDIANAGGLHASFYELSQARGYKKAEEPIHSMEIFKVRLYGHVLYLSPPPV